MALLTNQTLVNKTISFFEDEGEGGFGGDALLTTPLITDVGLVIASGGGLVTVINPIPVPPDDTYSPADNFILSATLNLSSITYATTALGLLTFQLVYNTDDGATEYSSFTPIFISNLITDVELTLTAVVANTGFESSDLRLYVRNNTGSSITLDYALSNIYFLKLSTGGTTQL